MLQRIRKGNAYCVVLDTENFKILDEAGAIVRWQENTFGSLTIYCYVCGLPVLVDETYEKPVVINKFEYLEWYEKKYLL